MRKLCDFCSEEFKEMYADYGCSVNTVSTLDEYTSYLNMLCTYLGKDYLDITEEDAQRYISHLLSKNSAGNLSKKTICVRLSCYKAVGRYVEQVKKGFASPFKRIRRPDKADDRINPDRIPSITELDAFMTVVKDDPMFFLIYALATRVGLSASTILQLKDSDVIIEDMAAAGEERSIVILRLPSKGLSSERFITLPSDVGEITKRYLAVAVPVDGYIFTNQHNRPMTIRNLDSATERFVRKSGINRYTMKDFRNRAILELAKSGVDLETIGEYAGLARMRVGTLATSKSIIGTCPVDMVNYQLKV